MAANFKIEVQNNSPIPPYLKVYLKGDADYDGVAKHLEKLSSVRRANVTEQKSGKKDLTVQIEKAYDIEEVKDDVARTLQSFFEGNPVAPSFVAVVDNVSDKSNSQQMATVSDQPTFSPRQSKIKISGHTRQVLLYLYKHRDEGHIYGSISFNLGLGSADKSEEICKDLYSAGVVEWRDNRVFITELGIQKVDQFLNEQDDRIREFVYEDYNFALLRFLYEQDMPLSFDEFPEILSDEAPKNTRGYPSMNLHHMLEIEFRKYIDSPMNKYQLNPAGRKYFEHQAKKKAVTLATTNESVSKKVGCRIFISYAHANQQWLQKVKVHLQALKNYSQIEFDYWDDSKLISGDHWENEIKHELERADIAILLITTDFLASEFIKLKELAPLLKKAEVTGTRIIPLIVSHSLFKDTPIAQFQSVNDPSHPLDSLTETEQNKILLKMTMDIKAHLSNRS